MGLVSFNTIPDTVYYEIFASAIFSLLMRSFVKIKPSELAKTTLSVTDVVLIMP